MFFPNEWKVARVNALHKKGPRNMLDNYRPISILPVVSKVFERILYKQLVEYLDALLSEHEFGVPNFVFSNLGLPSLQNLLYSLPGVQPEFSAILNWAFREYHAFWPPF